jgi:hypothetical protein
MPRPARISKTRVYDYDNVRLDRPSASSQPTAAPKEVWRRSRYKNQVASYELVLASYSARTPSTGGVPEFQHVLAWIVVAHHFPGVPTSGARPLPGATTVPRPPCDFVTVLEVFDAHTGKGLITIEGA